jgi:hypothetical protein
MATYKVEVMSRHGKFHHALFSANGPKGDPLSNKAFENIDDLVASLAAEIESKGLDEEQDPIIWRNIAYDDYDQLKREIRLATY